MDGFRVKLKSKDGLQTGEKNTSKRFKDDQAKRILEEREVAVATEVKGKSTEPSRKKIKGRGREIPW